jgi:hypothetical protein
VLGRHLCVALQVVLRKRARLAHAAGLVRRVHGAHGSEGGATVGEARVRLNYVRLHHIAARERFGHVELTPRPYPDEGIELLVEAGVLL